MFWTVLGKVLTPGLGAALSPMVIVAAIVLASAKGGALKVSIFAAGNFIALAGLGVAVVFAASGVDVATDTDRSKGGTFIKLLFGLLLWFLAWRSYKKRPAEGEASPIEQKLAALDSMPSGRILLLGVALGFLNAKNLPLTISTGTSVSQTGAGTTLQVVAMLIFAALGVTAVLAPAVIVKVAPNDSARVLGNARQFFVSHNTTIMVTVYVLLGASMISDSLGPLLG